MTELMYLEDCYLREFEARVESVVDEKGIILDKTAFYPNSGGQPSDFGRIVRLSDGKEFKVLFCSIEDNVYHKVDSEGLESGDNVKGIIDWDNRHTLMKMHTAAHVLSRVLFEETGATTSGNQLGLDKSRIDFRLENYDKEKILECVKKANEIIVKSIPVEKKVMQKDEAFQIEGFGAPSPHLIQDSQTLRVINIKGVDGQPCGGTHVNNTKEIGGIEFVKSENKGKSNRRVYYRLI